MYVLEKSASAPSLVCLFVYVYRARCQAKFLTSRRVRMRKVIFYISNTLRELMIRA